MWELIKKILEKWACLHDWELLHGHEIKTRRPGSDDWFIRSHIYHHKCKKCGKIKKITITV